ncbi:MAG: GNAT family N-acetyltransferase [Coriobacteriia bacterium]|nr:GNAT family N-acetyltransferase [Coriobacteriia bacterium]
MTARIIEAHSGPALHAVRALFTEYADWLGFSLDFQGFEDELARLPGEYRPPRGRLLLARADGSGVGCVALRPLEDRSCEMKRLYVAPSARGRGIGRLLVQRVVSLAEEIGYDHMMLDTLSARMPAAIALYESVGFERVAAYRHNPFEDAVYLRLRLT